MLFDRRYLQQLKLDAETQKQKDDKYSSSSPLSPFFFVFRRNLLCFFFKFLSLQIQHLKPKFSFPGK